MSTIKDVAKAANVSVMTVSRALNYPEKVAASSLARIEQAIVQLGYRKNHAATALVNKSTGIVKIVLADTLRGNDAYFTNLFAGIAEVMAKKRLAMLIVEDLAEDVKSDGMIVMGLKEGQRVALEDYPSPVVLFGKGNDKVDWIDVDNIGGTYTSTKHLLDLGHREIAFFKFDIDEPFIHEREVGYRKAMAEYDIEVKNEWIVTGVENSSVSSKLHALRVLRTTSVTGVVCTSDMVGLGVTQAAKELGINIPNELSVVGFDSVGHDLMSDPRLTTIKQPVFEVGKRLGEMLIERLQKGFEIQEPRHEIMSTELVLRDSTAMKK
jgi:DNA-binding LacI/PurR family transcriptional regulator